MPQTQKIVDAMKHGGFAERKCGGGGLHSQSLYEKIASLENLFAAWQTFVDDKHKRKDVQGVERSIEDHIFAIHRSLVDLTWRHGPYQQFMVCDPKPRNIHKATVVDRIVHHALVRVIEPMFDKNFSYDTWSCRTNKGTHAAVNRCRQQLRRTSQNGTRVVWILKCDIRKYFQSIDHEILLSLIKNVISDPPTLDIIRNIIYSFNPGLPLGNLTSQLFANVYLNPFDHFIQEQIRSPAYLRYCDDFILMHTDREWLMQQIPIIASYLSDTLRLELHPHKIQLRPWHWGIDWLGYVLYPDHIILRKKTKKRMQKNIHTTVTDYLNGNCGYDTVRSVLSSYDGLLRSTNENDMKKYLTALSRVL